MRTNICFRWPLGITQGQPVRGAAPLDASGQEEYDRSRLFYALPRLPSVDPQRTAGRGWGKLVSVLAHIPLPYGSVELNSGGVRAFAQSSHP